MPERGRGGGGQNRKNNEAIQQPCRVVCRSLKRGSADDDDTTSVSAGGFPSDLVIHEGEIERQGRGEFALFILCAAAVPCRLASVVPREKRALRSVFFFLHRRDCCQYNRTQ